MRYFSIDIETTGLKPSIHGVTEFACIMGDTEDQSVFASFYRWLNPEDYVWSTYCLRLHAKWIEAVTFRLAHKQTQRLSASEPQIMENKDHLFSEFFDWLDLQGVKPRITATGKNFGSFDAQFLQWDIFRHRVMEWVPFYTRRGDATPPDLEICKQRAIEAGCTRFKNQSVAHNALADALDVHNLIQFSHLEADLDRLRNM